MNSHHLPGRLRRKPDVDRIRILRQNAEQVLGVVAATFSSIDFSSDAGTEVCTHPASDGIHLHCRWTKVRKIAADDTTDNEVHVAALLEVLLLFVMCNELT